MKFIFYKVKSGKLSGTSWSEVAKNAFQVYKKIKSRTKRRPYIRSAYFHKEKIFFEQFWLHLGEQNLKDRVRRLKFFPCAIELLEKSRLEPEMKENPNRKNEILYRFFGLTQGMEKFAVQIKEQSRNRQKWLMSIFPLENIEN